MQHKPVIEDVPVPKRRKTPKSQRKAEIIALQVAGLTQQEIADKLGVSRQSIVRDLRDLRPTQQAVQSRLAEMQAELTAIMPIKHRARKYAELAESAKNEAVSLGALQRIDDLDGIITEREQLRAKSREPAQPQPIFILNTGAGDNKLAVAVSFGGANEAAPRSEAPRSLDVSTHSSSEARRSVDTLDRQDGSVMTDRSGSGAADERLEVRESEPGPTPPPR